MKTSAFKIVKTNGVSDGNCASTLVYGACIVLGNLKARTIRMLMLGRIQDFEKGVQTNGPPKADPSGGSRGMPSQQILKFKSSEMRFPAF